MDNASKDAKPPRCSVLMGVYNARRFVGEAVQSILDQTYRDIELVIINDGSTDGSLEVLQEYAMSDPRIRLVSRENLGIGATRNELLKLARGEYVATMDHDDISTPIRIATQIAYLDANPDVVCVGGNYDVIDEDGRHLITYNCQPLTHEEIEYQHLRGMTSINNPTAMMRRDAVVRAGGYDETLELADDLDLFLRLGEIGKVVNVPEIVLRYRELGTSASATAHQAQLDRMRIGTERAWKRRGISDGVFAAKTWRPLTREEKLERWLKYGWRGYARGDREHARAYAYKTIKLCPWRIQPWKLLYASLFKPFPARLT